MAQQAITDEVEVRCALGAVVLLLLTNIVTTLGPRGTDGVVLLLLATVLLALLLDRVRALLLGLTGWAFATGFVVNTGGDLTTGPADALRLAVFLLAGACVAARTVRRRPAGRPSGAQW
jgi:hypothetical protein